jgi:hypothetical protein
MPRATLTRVLLAAALVVATGIHEGYALTNLPGCESRCGRPGSGSSGDSGHSNNNVIFAVVGGILIAVIAWVIANQTEAAPPPPPPQPPYPPPPPPPGPPLAQVPITPPAPPSGGGTTTTAQLRPGCNLPPVGETRFVPTEVILDIPANVSAQVLERIAANHTMTREETVRVGLTGRTLHRWRIDSGTSVQDMIRSICTADRVVAGIQPNYVYELAQNEQEPVNNDQYAPQKLNLTQAHRLARGDRVLVAVIDSEVDATHPDIAGAVTANFDASADDERPHAHGTGMAGAIAAHRTMLGVAPRVGLLTIRAFSSKANSVEGTTFNILKGLDWAAAQGARVVNMSFAGPADPRLRDALQKAYKKGMVLVAAAGNAGPSSPPLFPGADPNVIAVTATDSDDALFPGANRGNYVAVAAPGVDILAPAPEGTYQLTTGTSVAAAEVSGVAALLIERNPALTPADVRKILMDTAKHLGQAGRNRDFGAGLVDALQAVTRAKTK